MAAPVVGQRRPKPSVGTLTRVRKAVFERDDWTCQYCGLKIPPKAADEESGRYAPRLGDLCLELDHIVPWVAGGLFIEENLRAACSDCNRKKSSSLVEATWPARFARARALMDTGRDDAETARKVVLILTGRDF